MLWQASFTGLACVTPEGVFDVLAYTDMDVAIPFSWIESDAKLIKNPQMVKLHSFDTKVGLCLIWFVLYFFPPSYCLGQT